MKLKINESKTLEFEMDTSGCSWKELKGYFRLNLDNVEYGFPARVEEGIIKVYIPVFKDILNEGVKSSLYKHKEVTVKARLDLVANNEAYISPWNGEIDIEIPVSVKIEEKEGKYEKKVTVIDPDVKSYLDEEKKNDKKSKLLDVFSKPLNESIKKEEKIEEKIEEKKDIKVKSRFSKILD